MIKTGALIIASQNLQKETNENEDMQTFLPMMSLEGSTIIKREIFTLRKAGISPIIVVCGYQKKILKNHLSHNGVVFCEDDRYENHDWEETLELGLKFSETLCDKILAVPVDRPLFSVDTIHRLKECEKNTVPVFNGKKGMPQLYICPGQEGKERKKEASEYLEVQDEGVLLSVVSDGYDRISAYARACRNENELRLKTKLILAKEEDFFGPGTCNLLKLVEEHGSIQAAAAQMRLSYSKAWKMINRAEKEMGFPFLKRSNGGKDRGGSTLTEEGHRFIDRYCAMLEDMKRVSQNFFDLYFQEFQ